MIDAYLVRITPDRNLQSIVTIRINFQNGGPIFRKGMIVDR